MVSFLCCMLREIWYWWFTLIFSIILSLKRTLSCHNNPLLNHKYEEYFQKFSLDQFLIKHTDRNVVLVIHLDIFNHIIIIFKSSQHRHGIAPFRMRFFQITWYNFEYHLRCVCVAQALNFFLCFDSSFFSAKGQLISKFLFDIFNCPKKRTKEFDVTTMVLQVELFSFVF